MTLPVLDGVFQKTSDGEVEFIEAVNLTDENIKEVARKIQRRVLNYMVRHDYIPACDAKNMLLWEHEGGFSVDASVRIEAHDRNGLEQLLRSCLRPTFSLQRLTLYDENTVIYHFKKPDIYGQTDF